MSKTPPNAVRIKERRPPPSLGARGEGMIWLSGGALAIAVTMIIVLLIGVLVIGGGTFWQGPLVEVKMESGRIHLGEVTRTDSFVPDESTDTAVTRRLIRTGNFEINREHFDWVREDQTVAEDRPAAAVLVERIEWGRFYGYPEALIDGESVIEGDRATVWQAFVARHEGAREQFWQAYRLKKEEIGQISRRLENARLESRKAELQHGKGSPQHLSLQEREDAIARAVQDETEAMNARIAALETSMRGQRLRLSTADGAQQEIALGHIVRALQPNVMGLGDKIGVYLDRWQEFLFHDPREANSEGGVWPALFGTVLMTLIMIVLVVPFGVLAALYLREYAKAGPVVSFVRICINNLAGVPSIVFGVVGLGFFCYTIGKWVDGGPGAGGHMPLFAWSIALVAVLTFGGLGVAAMVVSSRFTVSQSSMGAKVLGGILATAIMLGLIALVVAFGWGTAGAWVLLIPIAILALGANVYRSRRHDPIASRTPIWVSWSPAVAWICAVVVAVVVVWTAPFFDGFYQAKLPAPTYGKGGVLWASCTLALLTLPVVIVATEEALSAVPSSQREGSYGCGASKWQTIRRIVLPRAMPGIMTGSILAMARGAGEVAPLMLVGAVKLAPELPLTLSDFSGSLGFLPLGPLHPERSFMHLGFHIYDLGFQSQNSEAAKPMIYTTTLLLIGLVVSLNVVAIYLRGRMRRRFSGGEF